MKDLCNMSHLHNYTGEICKTLTINCHILLYDKLENLFTKNTFYTFTAKRPENR